MPPAWFVFPALLPAEFSGLSPCWEHSVHQWGQKCSRSILDPCISQLPLWALSVPCWCFCSCSTQPLWLLKACSTHSLLVLILSTCAHVVACPLHFHLISFDWEQLKSFHLDCSIFSHQGSTAPTPQPYKLRNQVGVSC